MFSATYMGQEKGCMFRPKMISHHKAPTVITLA